MKYKATPEETILDHLKNFPSVKSKDLKDLLSKYHDIDDNADKILSSLVKEGKIQRISKGIYKAKI
jgi:uncharacterized protein YaaN involved in tellurite resistance